MSRKVTLTIRSRNPVMNYIFYFGFGILTHLIAWGGEWYGLYSLALVVFWPFYLIFWLGFWAILLGAVIFAVIFALDFFGVKKIF